MTVERNVARVAFSAALSVLAGLAMGSTAVAIAAKPNLAILAPAAGSSTHEQQPQFSGTTDDALDPVTLHVYAGTDTTAAPVQTLVDLTPLAVSPTEATWVTAPESPLEPGQYTAVAEQTNGEPETGESPPVTFTIDTTPPAVSIAAPAAGAVLSTSQPAIEGQAGQAAGDGTTVTVKLYAGAAASGAPIQTREVTAAAGSWTTGALAALADGTYTVQAEQSDAAGNTGTSAAVTFTIYTSLPAVTLTSPATGSSTTGEFEGLGGAAGTAARDLPQVTVKLYTGSQITSEAPLQEVTVPAVNGQWSAAFGGLGLGTYTARAQQSNDLGRTGFSEPVTFTIEAPAVAPPPSEPKPTRTTTTTTATLSPPAASFRWFPANPRVGELVTLVSTSIDPTGPITGFAWSVAGDGVFTAGASTLTTSFAASGSHVVLLRVTGASGVSNVVAETISVILTEATLMQPFPVVRIAGSENATGVRVGLLTVQAPVGASVSVSCHGSGCPVHAQSVSATPGKGKSSIRAGVVTVVLRRFERSLRAGVVLEIRVSKPGQIGKYTRFTVRHGKLPTRADMCLSPAGLKPIACPSS